MVMYVVLLALVAGASGFIGWWIRGRELKALGGQADPAALVSAQQEASQAREKVAGLAATVEQLKGRVTELASERDQASGQARSAEGQAADFKNKLDTEIARIAEERKGLETLKQQVRDDTDALTRTFKALAGDIFDDKSKTFRELSKNQLDDMLKPLEQHLGELKKGVIDASKERDALLKEIGRMAMSADNLTHSLRGDSKVQGDWGEMTLAAILENCGLVKDESYKVQKEYDDDEGKGQKPDVILFMPENRQMIVDSKVSLTAYDRYMNEADDAKQAEHLTAHVVSVRAKIKELASKRYDHIPELNALEGVFMYCPIEGALIAAMQADRSLMADAVKQKIYPVGPTMFRASVTIVARLWRIETQNASVAEIFERGNQLYDRIRIFTESMDAMGASLDASSEAYAKARARLLTGKGNVAWQLERLLELGITPKALVKGDWAGTTGEAPALGLERAPPANEVE